MKKFLLLACCSFLFANNCKNFLINKIPKPIKTNIINTLKQKASASDKEILKLTKQALEPFGYISPNIRLNSCQIHVELGQPTLIKIVRDNEIIPKNIPGLKNNDIFNAQKYEQAIAWLYKYLKNLGYRDIDLSQSKIIIDPKKHYATIKIKAELGRKYLFGRILFDNNFISKSLIKRFLTFKIGEPYSILKLREMEDNLRKSGYFKSVKIIALYEQNNTIPIKIITTLHSKIQMLIGLGYDSVNSFKAIFNSRILTNKFGHILNNITNISKNLSTIQLQYLIPGRKPQEEKYITQASYTIDKTTGNKDTSINLSISYNKKNSFAAVSYGVNAINNKQTKADKKLKTNVLYPFATIEQNSTVMLQNHPAKQQWSASTLLAKKGFLSSIDIIQILAEYRIKIPLSEKYRIIPAIKLGINATNDPERQPLPTLLTLGGNNNLRGYAYNSIIDRVDKLQFLRAFSIEIQRKISHSIYGSVFIDAGQINREFFGPLLKGVGVGAIYSTTIGDISFNIAQPLDTPPDGSKKKLRFSVSYTM